MSQLTQGSSSSKPLFTAYVSDVRPFAAILRGIMLSDRATMTISAAGLALTVEEMRTSLAKAYILKGLFDEFSYEPPPSEDENPEETSQMSTTFELSLDTLLECLNIFGSGVTLGNAVSLDKNSNKGWRNKGMDEDEDAERHRQKLKSGSIKTFWGKGPEKSTMMKMTYQDTGYPLTLILAEDPSGPTTTVELTTLESAENLDLPFEDEDTVARVIMKSSWLREALAEVEPSCEKITFICSPPSAPASSIKSIGLTQALESTRPAFRIRGVGTFGTTEMDYPNDRDVLETFDCEEPVQFSYGFKPISRVVRSLATSIKSSLRIESSGLLSIQFQLPEVKGKNAYIDFLCLPKDDEAA